MNISSRKSTTKKPSKIRPNTTIPTKLNRNNPEHSNELSYGKPAAKPPSRTTEKHKQTDIKACLLYGFETSKTNSGYHSYDKQTAILFDISHEDIFAGRRRPSSTSGVKGALMGFRSDRSEFR